MPYRLFHGRIPHEKLTEREVGYHPILNIPSIGYLTCMKNRIIVNCVATSALALSFLLVGCDRKVSKTKTSSQQ